MKISSISDIHIIEDNDSRSQYLQKFLKSREVLSSDYIILLGDIFDLMVGNKKQYLKKFEQTFLSIKEASRNKKLIYISGNHDFSLKKILDEYFKEIDFEYKTGPKVLKSKDSEVYLSHGDEVDQEELSYQRWKRIYSNRYFQSLIDHVLPYKLIDKVGSNASKNSKKRSSKSFNYKEAKLKYQNQLKSFQKINKSDFYILGHTHIEILTETVANNGFVDLHKKFVFFDGESLSLVDLR